MGRVVGTAAERELDFEEELELMIGDPPNWCEGDSVFASEAERRAAYEGHRDQLGTWLGGFAGNRSSSFWEYDSDLAEARGRRPAAVCSPSTATWSRSSYPRSPRRPRTRGLGSARTPRRASTPKTATLYSRVCEALEAKAP